VESRITPLMGQMATRMSPEQRALFQDEQSHDFSLLESLYYSHPDLLSRENKGRHRNVRSKGERQKYGQCSASDWRSGSIHGLLSSGQCLQHAIRCRTTGKRPRSLQPSPERGMPLICRSTDLWRQYPKTGTASSSWTLCPPCHATFTHLLPLTIKY